MGEASFRESGTLIAGLARNPTPSTYAFAGAQMTTMHLLGRKRTPCICGDANDDNAPADKKRSQKWKKNLCVQTETPNFAATNKSKIRSSQFNKSKIQRS